MARFNNKNDELDVLPIMAKTALQGAGAEDDELRELAKALLRDRLEGREKERQRAQRMAEAAVQTAKEHEAAMRVKQRGCTHLKQDGRSTRLVGQWTSGTANDPTSRQLALICQFCGKMYHHPAKEGQEAPPSHLVPSADQIGG